MRRDHKCSAVRRKYEFIKSHQKAHSVQMMCRVLGVAPSGYYAWLSKPASDRTHEDKRLLRLIRASFTESQGVTCSKHRVARLMRENNLRTKGGYRTRRYVVGGKPIELIPNLVKRNFNVSQRNRIWVTDITYVRTWQGWVYLAVVLDLFSRKVVGWATRQNMHRDLALDALLMAVRLRKPDGTIVHSDQGSQYGSDDWRRFCQSNGLRPSMSRRGNCWDNAVAESFFSSLKKERIQKRIYNTRQQATDDIADYIEDFYNRTRRHQHLAGVSPDQFEATARL